MQLTRVAACLVILLAGSLGVFTYCVYATGQNWDETFHVKGALVSPADFSEGKPYRFAIDHPALGRYVYRWVLFGSGVGDLDLPDVDYHKSEEWNRNEGRLPPLRVVLPLRLTNAAFMTGAVALVFFTALLILRNAWFSLFVTAPLVLSERVAVGVVAYLGTDAILAFLLALSLFLWVFLAMRKSATGLLAIVLIGGAAGLAASTKANGALVIIAYALYLAAVTRGIDRAAKPFLAMLVCGVIFVLLNPVMRGGGIDWAVSVVLDMLQRRERIWLSQYGQAPLSRASLIARFFPWAAFVLPLAAALVALRREKWVLPTLLWAGVLVVGTLSSANRTYRRYFLPVEMAVFFTGGVAAWRLLQHELKRRVARRTKGADAGKDAKRRSAGIAISVLFALVFVTVAFTFVPWGPSRLEPGVPAIVKTKVFFRQAAGYFRLAEPLSDAQVRERVRNDLAGRARPETRAGTVRAPRPLFQPLTRQVLSTTAFLAACVVIVLVGRRALGSAWLGAAVMLPFMWTVGREHRLWTVSMSESLFALFALLTLLVWIDINRLRGAAPWRRIVLAAVFAAAAAAASPKAVALVVATLVLPVILADGRKALLYAPMAAVAAILAYLVMEPALWYLGARATLDTIQGVRWGALSFWTARFAETTDFLMPLQECFPYWPLLPLGGVVLYAARRETWALPTALWSGVIVAATILTLGKSAPASAVDSQLALAVGAGLSGLALLAGRVILRVGFRDDGS